ncbi:unnamed protein product [Orchesella dallaii]|uniref:Ectonucleotide pyrophosphatase/phosphodiesterase family member 6 n=1 Tax=Orchesella dallaii TaxID=48710 RepID=A0ABP1PLL3_9HEXA
MYNNIFKWFFVTGITTVILSNFLLTQEVTAHGISAKQSPSEAPHKLLIIMLDGFRWDYYSIQKEELPGFTKFLQGGVQAEYVEPVFPSLSYACWTTIGTGVYPEVHGVLGNYMYDRQNDIVFSIGDLASTQRQEWWQNSEPIWITATKNNKKAFLRDWSRCDVPFNGTMPAVCSGYTGAPGVEPIRDTLQAAVESLKGDFELVMVYGEHIDNVGHRYGPDSPELKQAVREVDQVLEDFLQDMEDAGLDETVNIIIVGDHGMKFLGEGSGSPKTVKFLNLSDYINATDVFKVVDKGAHLAIATLGNTANKVYQSLQGNEGFDVYRRNEIPDEFHYKHGRLAQDILVVAHPNYYIRGLQSPNQIPAINPNAVYSGGTHGYVYNMSDMRTIFFARGPAFQQGIVTPPINLVDEYQMFAHLLDIPAQPHNGTWSKVSGMLKNSSVRASGSVYSIIIFVMAVHVLSIT